MKKIKQYSEKANEYDSRNSSKNYKLDCEEMKKIHLKDLKGNELLDVGCGTGEHLKYLKGDFNCTGIDIHQEMLDLARKKLGKSVKLLKANMSSFNLNKKFDAIICLYSVINYAKNYATLRKTIKNFYNNLQKGGIVIIEPDYTTKIYKNFTGKEKRNNHMIMNEIGKWSKIMKEEGFNVKYFYRGLNGSAKGLYVLKK